MKSEISASKDLEAIAAKYGTPMFVYDADVLSSTARSVRTALDERISIYYSLKANPNVSVVSTLMRAGTRAEVSSLAELRTAINAGHPAENVIFLGPGKTDEEIAACIDLRIRAIVCESFEELERINDASYSMGTRTKVVLRVNPSFELKGSGLTMGGKARQFGIDEEQLAEFVDLRARFASVDVLGVHAYMGTRILNEPAIVQNTRRILEMARRIAAIQRFPLKFVSVGGGWGVPYFEGESPINLQTVADGVNEAALLHVGSHPETEVAIELGRYLTALAGAYVTSVLYTKTSRGESFAVVDGGTNHHAAAGGVGSFVKRNFPVVVVGAEAGTPTSTWNLAGPLCTPNDLIVKKAELPDLTRGDLVAVLRSGAYGPSASPGLFLSHGFPTEVLLRDGEAHLIRAADSTEDLLARQILVDTA
ncbi:type III PLP-dependent enzyme [Curtobacterium sp. MCPF17_031]|uniref:type III PLP-dependent enzyme n=1 Tax=Curtobacterium sp. MCPF17_031 TaxID=2175653 RepID=UPI000DAA8330|nr:type III PLP-dependent enzyme [Curtobacterium sp. MCPF17_031]PZE34233.1 diaminopimelate decarboxylase [Curtobacterium sp. MCPF17_031]